MMNGDDTMGRINLSVQYFPVNALGEECREISMAYFPLRENNRLTLYQDADTPQLPHVSFCLIFWVLLMQTCFVWSIKLTYHCLVYGTSKTINPVTNDSFGSSLPVFKYNLCVQKKLSLQVTKIKVHV